MWWKRNRGKVILAAVIAAALAFAFWYGGNAPGLHGWTAADTAPSPRLSAVPSGPAQATAALTPAPTDATPLSRTPAPTPSPTPTPTEPPALASAEPSAPPAAESESAVPGLRCTVSIRCDTLLDNLDALDEEKRDLVPQDGVILAPTAMTFEPGESAFDALRRACQENQIHIEFTSTPVYGSAYIEGIQNLYEFDCGELSGWMYCVNGQYPNYGASGYALQDGDVVEWRYTCDQGADIGSSAGAGG